MPYIARDDGEHFVIPSYRDILSAKQKSALKKEILLLSQSYGEYITLQRKAALQYEVAFSPDTGYLLGESIWHYFKRPLDMIYCEAIPNTTEAILVIVKGGSVYLDGRFPLDSIAEELIIFLTQQNNFEIYLYGHVPISQTPEEGKFSFETTSVKSFALLDKPIFSTLPLLKIYQLQLVDPVLKAHGIGVFPTRQFLTGGIVIGLLWMIWSYMTSQKTVAPTIPIAQTNPYQPFMDALHSPAPDQEINTFLEKFKLLLTMPGWTPDKIDYAKETLTISVKSDGSKIENLMEWAKNNHMTMNITPAGIFLTTHMTPIRRPMPTKIYPLQDVVTTFVDRLSTVYPGNHLQMGNFDDKGMYSDVVLTLNLDSSVSPAILALLGAQWKDLPFVIQKMTLSITNGLITGSIIVDALGTSS